MCTERQARPPLRSDRALDRANKGELARVRWKASACARSWRTGLCSEHEIAVWSRAAIVAKAPPHGTGKGNVISFAHLVTVGCVDAAARHLALHTHSLRGPHLGGSGAISCTRHQQIARLGDAPTTPRTTEQRAAPEWARPRARQRAQPKVRARARA